MLELHERLSGPGPALELQILRVEEDRLLASWVPDNGMAS